MRHDLRNTGSSELRATVTGATPWSFPTGRGIFATPVIGADGTIYVGWADHVLYGFTPAGEQVWRFATGGAAYAINSDGTPRWAYQAANAVWTVPAIDDSGVTYWGSVDTTLFALNPDGSKKWQRTTLGYVTSSPALIESADGAPIRSSPVVGRTPDGTGRIVYVGSSNGQLYANRNMLNSSPALGPEGIYLGSQDGVVWGVPYDYCLRVAAGELGRRHR